MKTLAFLIVWWTAKFKTPAPIFKCKCKAIAYTVYPDGSTYSQTKNIYLK